MLAFDANKRLCGEHGSKQQALPVIAVLRKMRCDLRVYDRSDCQNQLEQAKSFDFTLLHAGFSIRRMSDSSISLNR